LLTYFSVEGFKNFNKKIEINFADVRDYKFHPEYVTDELLNTVIIYGKNSIGKTNFGLALFDIVSHLTLNNVTPGLYNYYLNSDNKNTTASFEYRFCFDDNEIIYGYSKTEKNEIDSEFLMIDDIVIYHISESNWENNALIDLLPNLNWKHNTNMSPLKYVYYNSNLDTNHPIIKMMKFINNMLWFRCLGENRFIGYKEKADDYFTFLLDNKDYMDEFNVILRKANIEIGVSAKKEVDGKTRLYFDTKVPLPFWSVASSGTKALYMFYYWYKTAPNVSIMYIDEFDAFYHHELAEGIITLIKKIPQSQKILTTHNTNLLSNRIMRPDCYFILTSDKLTSFANATKRELREGHNLEKLYMSGEFDA